MAAHYYNITEDEMDEFLVGLGFKKIVPDMRTKEIVYGKRVDQDDKMLTLRVYTGIVPGFASRGVGEDAIRLVLMMKYNDRIVKISGDKRVHRVQGWKKNLGDRIQNWTVLLPKHSCEKCGMPMIPRKSKHGEFLGCSGWPACNNKLTLSASTNQD